jgi:hypothetical protein
MNTFNTKQIMAVTLLMAFASPLAAAAQQPKQEETKQQPGQPAVTSGQEHKDEQKVQITEDAVEGAVTENPVITNDTPEEEENPEAVGEAEGDLYEGPENELFEGEFEGDMFPEDQENMDPFGEQIADFTDKPVTALQGMAAVTQLSANGGVVVVPAYVEGEEEEEGEGEQDLLSEDEIDLSDEI